jgi:hypothetical protein
MKQVDIVWRNHGTYDVNKLWNKSWDIKTRRIYLDKIIHNLDKDLWTVFNKNHKAKYITPNQVIKNPYVSPYDFCKIMNADLSYPIIIYNDNGDLDVLDGLHRLAKSVILERKTICVKYVSDDILLKCKIKK